MATNPFGLIINPDLVLISDVRKENTSGQQLSTQKLSGAPKTISPRKDSSLKSKSISEAGVPISKDKRSLKRVASMCEPRQSKDAFGTERDTVLRGAGSLGTRQARNSIEMKMPTATSTLISAQKTRLPFEKAGTGVCLSSLSLSDLEANGNGKDDEEVRMLLQRLGQLSEGRLSATSLDSLARLAAPHSGSSGGPSPAEPTANSGAAQYGPRANLSPLPVSPLRQRMSLSPVLPTGGLSRSENVVMGMGVSGVYSRDQRGKRFSSGAGIRATSAHQWHNKSFSNFNYHLHLPVGGGAGIAGAGAGGVLIDSISEETDSVPPQPTSSTLDEKIASSLRSRPTRGVSRVSSRSLNNLNSLLQANNSSQRFDRRSLGGKSQSFRLSLDGTQNFCLDDVKRECLRLSLQPLGPSHKVLDDGKRASPSPPCEYASATAPVSSVITASNIIEAQTRSSEGPCNFLEFCSVGVQRDVLSGAVPLRSTAYQPGCLRDVYPSALAHSSPSTFPAGLREAASSAPLKAPSSLIDCMESYCFPQGAALRLVSASEARRLALSPTQTEEHILQFRDASGKPTYAAVVTNWEILPISHSHPHFDALLVQRRRDAAATHIQRAMRRALHARREQALACGAGYIDAEYEQALAQAQAYVQAQALKMAQLQDQLQRPGILQRLSQWGTPIPTPTKAAHAWTPGVIGAIHRGDELAAVGGEVPAAAGLATPHRQSLGPQGEGLPSTPTGLYQFFGDEEEEEEEEDCDEDEESRAPVRPAPMRLDAENVAKLCIGVNDHEQARGESRAGSSRSPQTPRTKALGGEQQQQQQQIPAAAGEDAESDVSVTSPCSVDIEQDLFGNFNARRLLSMSSYVNTPQSSRSDAGGSPSREGSGDNACEETWFIASRRAYCLLSDQPCHNLLFAALEVMSRRDRDEFVSATASPPPQQQQQQQRDDFLRAVQMATPCMACDLENSDVHTSCNYSVGASAYAPALKVSTPLTAAPHSLPAYSLSGTSCQALENAFADWSVACAACILPSQALLQLHALLLMEKSLVVVARHPGVATVISSALVRMLCPFRWEGVFVPLITQLSEEIMQAPVPFVVGTVRSPRMSEVSPSAAVLYVDDYSSAASPADATDADAIDATDKRWIALPADDVEDGCADLSAFAHGREGSAAAVRVDTLSTELRALLLARLRASSPSAHKNPVPEKENESLGTLLSRPTTAAEARALVQLASRGLTVAEAALASAIQAVFWELTVSYLGDLPFPGRDKVISAGTLSRAATSAPEASWDKYVSLNAVSGFYEFQQQWFLEPFRQRLRFHEKLVHTQLFASFADDLRLASFCEPASIPESAAASA